jgi:hypothetical protein
VLKPGGRTALFETVNKREQWRPSEIWPGVGVGLYRVEEIEPIRDLATRLVSSLESIPLETMTSAGHTEYLHMCEDAGFAATYRFGYRVAASAPGEDRRAAQGLAESALADSLRSDGQNLYRRRAHSFY